MIFSSCSFEERPHLVCDDNLCRDRGDWRSNSLNWHHQHHHRHFCTPKGLRAASLDLKVTLESRQLGLIQSRLRLKTGRCAQACLCTKGWRAQAKQLPTLCLSWRPLMVWLSSSYSTTRRWDEAHCLTWLASFSFNDGASLQYLSIDLICETFLSSQAIPRVKALHISCPLVS